MTISHERPRIFDRFERAFRVKWEDGIVIAWSGTIYCKNDVPPDVVYHEGVHLKQQADMGKEKWLKKYLTNPEFRLEMEKEAYIAQAKLIKHGVTQRNNLYLCLREIAQDFSHSTYGSLISFDEALKILRAA